LISSALHTAPSGAQSYASIVVDREDAPWLLVEAMPVTAFGSDLFSSGRLILLLTDLTSPLRPEATQLCAAFGLTVAEAKIAAKVASGMGLDGAAASLGISRETARTQLKAVFAKTNTRRQAELAALVARLRC
jgi:DNA-binding CsgD family transcriptional regulator